MTLKKDGENFELWECVRKLEDAFELLKQTVDVYRISYGDDEKSRKIVINMQKVAKKITAFKAVIKKSAPHVFTITVDYSKSLNEMIEAGDYSWISEINQHFTVSGKGHAKIVVELLYFDDSITTSEIHAEMDNRGLRPAKIEELLALGAWLPKEQIKFPIIAIGSVWESPNSGNSAAPYLSKSGCLLDVFWFVGEWDCCEWNNTYLFLAVRK